MKVRKTTMAFLASLATAIACASVPDYATLVAHRGESDDAPENTLPAYKMAVERGFGFECDVYLSKDGRVFTFHDWDLKRTTGGLNTNKCCDVTWTEIEKLDVGNWGRWKNSAFKGTRPALLEEVLELARDGRFIYVEVKPGPEIVPFIKKVFNAQSKATPKNTLFISFNEESCKALKAQMPKYKVYWLVSPKGGTPLATPKGMVSRLKQLGVDGVDCCYKPDIVTADFVRTVRAAGYEFHAWTVDDLSDTIQAFCRGVQTVTTNCAKKQLDAWHKAEVLIKNKQNHYGKGMLK